MFVVIIRLTMTLVAFTNLVFAIITQIVLWGIVLFFLKCAVMFWLNPNQVMMRDSANINQRIPQMKMMKVHIPFTFKLQDNPNPSSEEIMFKVSSQTCYRLFAFWGVSIRELHVFLWRPWMVILSSIEQGTLLEGHYQLAGTHLRSEMHSENIVRMKIPDVTLELGTPPRHYYPLVILLLTDNTDESHPNETVALINVVHIKDMVCTLPTSVLAQYLKQANGQLSSLKQLYMAASSPVTYTPDLEFVDNLDHLCVVCQHFPFSRALLPCRHTCICAACFGKLDTCPMCRSPITSYFCIRSEEYILEDDKSNSTANRYELLTNWFHNRFGFLQQ